MVKKNILGVMAIALLFGLMVVSLWVITTQRMASKIKKLHKHSRSNAVYEQIIPVPPN